MRLEFLFDPTSFTCDTVEWYTSSLLFSKLKQLKLSYNKNVDFESRKLTETLRPCRTGV
jgi:hypothetical protein